MIVDAPALRLAVPERLDGQALKGFDPNARIAELSGPTMGTTWRSRLALPPGRDPATLGRKVQDRLDGIVAELSHWDPGSLLSQFNTAKAGSWIPLPRDFARVIGCALAIAEQSGGAFDPAQGRVTDLWGLGPNPADGEPGAHALAEARRQGGWRQLAFDAATGRLRQPGGLWLDLSGIAKGHAVDAVADLLAADGLYHALVEIGGECVGRGIRPDGDPWWVDAETPAGHALPGLRIALHQIAVASSGDYLRGAHAIDPATGLPAIHQTTAVTVIHESCMAADAWATGLNVLPPPAARRLAEERRLMARLVTREGGEWISPALCQLL